MKNIIKYFFYILIFSFILSCSKDDTDHLKTKTYPIEFSIGDEEIKWHNYYINAYLRHYAQDIIITGLYPEKRFELVIGDTIINENWNKELKGKSFKLYSSNPTYFFIENLIATPNLGEGYFFTEEVGEITITNYEEFKLSFTITGEVKSQETGDIFPLDGVFENIPVIEQP